MSLILLASLCFFPFTVAFRQNTTNGLMAFLDFFNLVDIVINFYTGIFQRSYCDVILPLKRIAGYVEKRHLQILKFLLSSRYVCTHFFFDLASSFPVYLLLFFFDVEIGTFFETLRLFKIARLHTLFVYMNTAFRVSLEPFRNRPPPSTAAVAEAALFSGENLHLPPLVPDGPPLDGLRPLLGAAGHASAEGPLG